MQRVTRRRHCQAATLYRVWWMKHYSLGGKDSAPMRGTCRQNDNERNVRYTRGSACRSC